MDIAEKTFSAIEGLLAISHVNLDCRTSEVVDFQVKTKQELSVIHSASSKYLICADYYQILA